jgi:hypothetical protein
VTRLAKLGLLFTLGSFFLITEVVKCLDYFSAWQMLCTNFDKKWVGLHFGRFFLKLIGSPCPGLNWPTVRTKHYQQLLLELISVLGPRKPRIPSQGCQMAYFQTKNQNLGKFWRALQRNMLEYFSGHLGYFTDVWSIMWPSGIMLYLSPCW